MSYRSISSQVLTEEAQKLGLEVDIINREKNLFLVKSKDKEVLFKSTDCGLNSSLGLKITNDKELTYNMLERAKLPVAHTKYVTEDEVTADFDDAGFTYPLVIKPLDGAHGDGVMMNISSKDELLSSLKLSFVDHKKMIIQDQVEGDEYRFVVLDGKVILVFCRAYPKVIGDGSRTIGELIDYENKSNPLRGERYTGLLAYIKIDDETIKHIGSLGHSLDTILPNGQKITVRRNSNIGSGGVYKDVTAITADIYKNNAIDAVQCCQLGFAGVDILTADITNGAINSTVFEVGATPGIGGHRDLTETNTPKKILEYLFEM